MAKLFFNQKFFQFFSQNVPSFGNVYYIYYIPYMGNTVDFLPYVESRGKHGEMRWTPKE